MAKSTWGGLGWVKIGLSCVIPLVLLSSPLKQMPWEQHRHFLYIRNWETSQLLRFWKFAPDSWLSDIWETSVYFTAQLTGLGSVVSSLYHQDCFTIQLLSVPGCLHSVLPVSQLLEVFWRPEVPWKCTLFSSLRVLWVLNCLMFFWNIIYYLFKTFLHWIWLVYNVVPLSTVQQGDSVIPIYTLFFMFFSITGLSQYIEHSSLCCTLGPGCFLSTLNVIVCIYQPQTSSLSFSTLHPLANTSLLSMLMRMFLSFLKIYYYYYLHNLFSVFC